MVITYNNTEYTVIMWSDFMGVLDITHKNGSLCLTGAERDRVLRQLKHG
jgi:hypothetical protein